MTKKIAEKKTAPGKKKTETKSKSKPKPADIQTNSWRDKVQL